MVRSKKGQLQSIDKSESEITLRQVRKFVCQKLTLSPLSVLWLM